MVVGSCRVGGLFGTDCQLRFLPQRFQFLDAAVLKVPSQGGFHTRETIEKALVGAREAFFWLDVTPASHIHKGEQQVAELFLSMLWITG